GSFKDQYGAYAILPGIDPASIQVDADIKANSYLIGFDYKQYFLSASNTLDGGLYFLIGFGFNLTKRKTSFDYGNYDGSNYVFEPTSGIASQSTFKYFSMKGGQGYDIDVVEYVKLYIEGNARFTALKIGMSEAVEINIPTVIGASLGIRFQL
ncbi:MAG: hypothetical protein JKX68_05265, partial [Flavobacteriales bacterium]|nr:hypothetical protein [Flavobacteriales bacterium]